MLKQRFPQFRRFPPEVRNLIWKAALPNPRIVHVLCSEVLDEETIYLSSLFFGDLEEAGRDARPTAQSQLQKYGFTSSRPTPHLPPQRGVDVDTAPNRTQYRIRSRSSFPVLLHTCTESAAVMESQGWVRAFGTAVSPPICFNFRLDTLYLTVSATEGVDEDFEEVLPYFAAADLKRLRNIAIHWEAPSWDWTSIYHWREASLIVRNFECLATCTFIMYDEQASQRDKCLKLLGKEVMDPGPTKNPGPAFDRYGDALSLRVEEQTYSGIVARIYEGLHILREADVRSGGLHWSIPMVRLAAMAYGVGGTYLVGNTSHSLTRCWQCSRPCCDDKTQILGLMD